MAHPSPAPATKEDIQLLMQEIGKLYDANARWKGEIEDRIDASEERMKRHFDMVVETIRHDLLGAHKDRIENHENRLTHVERRLGIA